MHYAHMDSLVGTLLLAGDDKGLRLISFPTGSKRQEPGCGWRKDIAPLVEAKRQIDAYFAGELTEFDLALAPHGTPFQLSVWRALCDVPYGTTVSYGELARTIGRPKASRAVGTANGANPLPIVIPCHRVIGSTGKLTGFGGGLDTKAALLALEREGCWHASSRGTLPFTKLI